MSSVQTQRMPQVGFPLDKPFNSSVSIPFESIRLSGRLNRMHGKDNRDAAFWNNTLIAEVGGQRYIAKVYTQSSGGERAFEHDLERLVNDKGSNIPRVFGHSSNSATPCILFATSHVLPFHVHLGEMLRTSPETAVQDAWQLLIDMKDAAEGLLRNYPSLPSSVLCDALAKASVDDERKIILTPEVSSGAYNSKESVEELVQTAWSEFLRTGQYRPLRPLGYALAGNPQAVLGTSPHTFDDTASALRYLKQFWIAPSRRYLSWPSEVKGCFEPGDIGVFEVHRRNERVFRKLGSVSTEFGGVVTNVDAGNFEEVQPGVFRKTCNPLPEGGQVNPVSDYFLMSWTNTLKESKNEWDWLCANVGRLASEHGVEPEDLVLLTETCHGLDAASLETLTRTTQIPIHYYVHLDAVGRAFRCYWTFRDAPISGEGLSEIAEDPEVKGLPLPVVEMHFGKTPFPVQYLQIENIDL